MVRIWLACFRCRSWQGNGYPNRLQEKRFLKITPNMALVRSARSQSHIKDTNVQVESTTWVTGIKGMFCFALPLDPRDPRGLLFLNTQVKNALNRTRNNGTPSRRLHRPFISGRPVERRNGDVIEPQVDCELAAMM